MATAHRFYALPIETKRSILIDQPSHRVGGVGYMPVGSRKLPARDKGWILAPVVPDALIVNSGELSRQWSNDRVLSTRHFANNKSDASRYSVPFFCNANAEHPMECLPSCCGPDNPAKYPPVSYRRSQGVVQGE